MVKCENEDWRSSDGGVKRTAAVRMKTQEKGSSSCRSSSSPSLGPSPPLLFLKQTNGKEKINPTADALFISRLAAAAEASMVTLLSAC